MNQVLKSLRGLRVGLSMMILLLGSCVVNSAYAQLSTASLNGNVRDTTGANLPGATVTLRNMETSVEKSTVSNSVGAYVFVSISPGRYTLRVTATGFKPTQIPEFTLTVGQVAQIEIPVAVGSAETQVTVESSSTQMDTSSANLGTVIGTKQVNDLPLNGRNFTQLLALTPGISTINKGQSLTNRFAPVAQGASVTFPAVNGQSNRSNFFLLDGLNDNEFSRSTYAVPPIIDAIQEFKVVSHTDDAAFGGVVGGVVNVVTKSGTNGFHGSAWEYARNGIFDARSYFLPTSQPRPAFSQNQFGAAVGGPVWLPKLYNGKNRTFFFGSYQGFRFAQDKNTLLKVPTAAQLAGDESSVTTKIYNPFTTRPDPTRPGIFIRDPFPGNQIQSLVDPRMVAYAKFLFPAAGPQLDAAGDNAQFTAKSTQSIDEWSARVDQKIGKNDSVWFRYSFSNSTTTNPAGLPDLNSSVANYARNWGASYVHVFSPSLILQGQFARTHITQNTVQRFQKSTDSIYNTIGFADGYAGAYTGSGLNLSHLLPTLSITGYAGSGESYNIFPDATSVYHPSLNVTKVWGNHIVQIGAGFGTNLFHISLATSGLSFGNPQTANTDPTDTVNTGNALASFLINVPTGANRRDEIVLMRFGGVGDGYITDSWKVNDKLTLNYGLRYDYILPPALGKPGDLNSGYYTGDMDLTHGVYILQAVPPPCSIKGVAPCIPGTGVLPDHVVVSPNAKILHNQYGDYGPRFGFAYRVFDKTVLRGAYGIVYDAWSSLTQQIQGTAGSWPDNVQPSVSNLNVPTTAAPKPTINAQNPFAGPGGGAGGLPAASPFTASAAYFDPTRQWPLSHQWNVGLEQMLSRTTTMTLNYVGSVSTQLDMGGFYNTALTPGTGSPQSRALFTYIAPTQYDRTFGGGANYNALQVSLNRRDIDGFSYGVAYTWSKVIDIGTDGSFGVEGSDPQDPYDPAKYDTSVAGYDLTHALAINTIYQVPLGKGKRFSTGSRVADYILGQWQLNNIFTATSGFPFYPTVTGDRANTGNGRTYEHANLVGNPHLDHPSAAQWFNTAAFATPAQYTYGNAPRNSLRTQAYWNLDTSLFRLFPVGEGRAFEFRAEAFNITNHPVLGTPVVNVTSAATFGTINTTSSTARQLQLAMKFRF